MKATLEPPRSELLKRSITAFTIQKETQFPWNWHYHPEMELTWISRGGGTRSVGDNSSTYAKDDLVLLGANLPHNWYSKTKSIKAHDVQKALVIQFRPGILPDALLELPEFSSIAQLLQRSSRGLLFSKAAARETAPLLNKLLGKTGLESWSGLLEILEVLARRQDAKVLASARYRHRRSYRLNSRLEEITTFIEQNCHEELTLDSIAKKAHLSPSAFSRFFRKMTQTTFVSYRNACRIQRACRLLIDTDLTVTQIGFDCGFGGLANFHRIFMKDKKVTPLRYRRLHLPSTADL